MRPIQFAFAMSLISAPAMAQMSCPQLVVGSLEAHAMAPAPISEITGSARNAGNTTLQYVSITFNLLDEGNNVVGNTVANGVNLEAGQGWRFSAIATVAYSTFKVSGVSCPRMP